MSAASAQPAKWDVIRRGAQAELQLTGDWLACETGARSLSDVQGILDEASGISLRVDGTRLWSLG